MIQRYSLPPAISNLVKARNELREHYKAYGLSFTLDGNLVGDLGEALAADIFGIDLTSRSAEGVDGIAPCGRSVQIKASGTRRGPAFRQVATKAQHLLFFHLDFESCSAELLFNGPEAVVLRLLPETWRGQRMASVGQVIRANETVSDEERLCPVKRKNA
jgi:hypothetical protein